MSEIKVSGLSHVYSADTPFEKVAINDVNVEIPHGQLVGLIGHTGSGKSTFIQHLNGLLKPSKGTVTVDGVDINADKTTARDVRFKVGLVFQYPEYQLFEETVYADIAFGPKNMKLPQEQIDERVREAAALVGVSEELFERSPLELSGGQKRRVAIAGVIAMRPGVLILDEPTAGLDPAGCRQILKLICDYRETTGSTVIIVSHSMDDVARIADRLIVFSKGGIRFDAAPGEVFSHTHELMEIGLSVPAPALIAQQLRQQGVEINEPVYTDEQLLAVLLKLGREAGINA
jgi:energy-coupling factor transport system ATP-binding protein